MDNYRPTIVVTEMVGYIRNCVINYKMKCSLSTSRDVFVHFPLNNLYEHQFETKSVQTDLLTSKNRRESIMELKNLGGESLSNRRFGGPFHSGV
jgi:hypothetical protein